VPAPVYQRIAGKALRLRQLGLSFSAVARRLGVTGRTVAKGIAWLRHARRRTEGEKHLR